MKYFRLSMRCTLLTMLLLLPWPSGAARGANAVTVEGVTYEWQSNLGAYVATGWDEETPVRTLHIRGEVDGLDVVAVARGAFEDQEGIVYLIIDEGITSIGENAFGRCTGLRAIVLPEGLERIDEEAFAFCTGLTTVTIPSTVTDLYAHSFTGCTGVTDVYFLMTDASQLDEFAWWDGTYATAGEEEHGGMEFNTREHTVIHVPQGMLQDYEDSGKFEAWLPLHEDDNCYPLWWIVNCGVVGREYTVSDELEAIYADCLGSLYAKDDNRWLTPDVILPGELDYMTYTGMMSSLGNHYDQSNWVEITGMDGPEQWQGTIIAGGTLTGQLLDKRNPVIALSDGAQPEACGTTAYEPNVYIPAAFMGRAQQGELDGRTYAFVQPKPQELIHVEWVIFCEDDECFYLPAPDEDAHINYMGLKGGFAVCYDLYEGDEPAELTDGGAYAFHAINRRQAGDDRRAFNPHVDGGLSDYYTVYPLKLLDDPIATSLDEVPSPHGTAIDGDSRWYTIDGRCLGTDRPTAAGLYITCGRKVAVK